MHRWNSHSTFDLFRFRRLVVCRSTMFQMYPFCGLTRYSLLMRCDYRQLSPMIASPCHAIAIVHSTVSLLLYFFFFFGLVATWVYAMVFSAAAIEDVKQKCARNSQVTQSLVRCCYHLINRQLKQFSLKFNCMRVSIVTDSHKKIHHFYSHCHD